MKYYTVEWVTEDGDDFGITVKARNREEAIAAFLPEGLTESDVYIDAELCHLQPAAQ